MECVEGGERMQVTGEIKDSRPSDFTSGLHGIRGVYINKRDS